MLTDLPREIIHEIQSFVPIQDIYHMSMVNKMLNDLNSSLLKKKKEEYEKMVLNANKRCRRFFESIAMKGSETLSARYGDILHIIEAKEKKLSITHGLDDIEYHIHDDKYPLDSTVKCFFYGCSAKTGVISIFDEKNCIRIIQRIIFTIKDYSKDILFDYFMYENIKNNK